MARNSTPSDSSRYLRVLATVAIVVFITAALHWVSVVFVPLTLAIFLAFILTPPVAWLQRRKLGRLPAVILVVGATVLMSGAVGIVVGRQLMQLTRTLPDHEGKIKAKVLTVKGWISSSENDRLATLANEIQSVFVGQKEAVSEAGSMVVVDASPSWIAKTQTFLTPAVEMLGQAAFTFILVVFMLLKREDLRNRMIRLLGEGQVTTTTKAVDDASRRISRFLLAQILLNTAFGLVITIGLLIMQVPYAPLWGFTAFLMRYIPYVGTWIGVLPPAVFTFAVSDGLALPLGVVALFLGLEILCNNLVEPMLYGKQLGLSEVAQLVATAFWAFLWGPIGMILAWPLTTCLLVVGKYFPQFRFLNVLLGDQPVLAPQVAFYQRLAAGDQDEADKIVEKELATRPVEEVFDDLLIPSLVEVNKDLAAGRISDKELAFITAAVRDFSENATDLKIGDKPASDRVRLVLTPARNLMEQAALELLARTLEPSLWEIEIAPADFLTAELVARVEAFVPAILVLGSLPPEGLTHTRVLCKRIRQKFPNLKIVIGRWGASDEIDESGRKKLKESGADEIARNLTETRTILSGWRGVFAAPRAIPGAEKSNLVVRAEIDGMARA